MRIPLRLLVLLLTISAFFLGADIHALEKVRMPRPEWCDNPPQTLDGDLAFEALSNAFSADEESKARLNAINLAGKKVTDYIGIDIKAEFERIVKVSGDDRVDSESSLSFSSFSQQTSQGLVKRLKIIEWYKEELDDGRIQVCVLTTISPAAIRESIQETTKKAEQHRREALREMESLLRAAIKRQQEGHIIPALRMLKGLKSRIRKTNITNNVVDLSQVEIVENEIIGRLRLKAESPLLVNLDFLQQVGLISFRVLYQGSQDVPLPSFPVVCRYNNKKEAVVTNSVGLGSYSMKPAGETREHVVAIVPDVKKLAENLSPEALKHLKTKQLVFRMKVELDNLLFKPFKSDFNFRVRTESDQVNFKVNQPFKVYYSCYRTRCYQKIFGYEKEGPVFVIRDTKDQRVLVDQLRSFDLKGESKGCLTVFGIVSTKPFPVNFKSGQSIKRSEFKGVLKALRECPGKKVEYELRALIN